MINLSIIRIVGILAIYQTFLAFIIFARKKGEEYKILSSIFLILSILLVAHSIGSIRELWNYLILSIIGHQFIYLLGPVFYLYVQSIAKKNTGISKYLYILHFLPFILFEIAVVFILTHYNMSYYYYTFSFFSNGLLCVYFPIYLWLSVLVLKKANISLKNLCSFSSIKNDKRHFWICNIGLGFVLLSILKIFTFFSWNLVKAGQLCIDLSTLTLIGTFLLVSTAIYSGLGYSKLFLSRHRYGSSQINTIDTNRLLNRIIEYFEKDRPYLDSEFNLNTLSTNLNIPSRYISQILNQEYGYSFLTMVNKYRIEEAKKLIWNNGNDNLLQIAIKVGYNSKSTFIAAFKKNEGMTPKEYKKRTK